MSLIKLQGNASGTGALTIAAPNTNTDRTLTLPDATGTVNVSGLANEVPAGSAGAPAIYPTGDSNTGIFFPAADTIAFAEGGAEVARFDSSGNLGIGTTSPTAGYRLDVRGQAQIGDGGGNADINFNASNIGRFLIAGTERARIDSSGNLMVGTTSDIGGLGGRVQIASGGSRGIVQSTNANVRMQEYLVSSSTVGFISNNGTATTYATSSDYRLKENVAPMQNALDTVARLNPVTYTWKADGSAGQGFIAHELQAVVPDCVTGEKDAVDETGNPQYQGVDTSFLVATLVAAIKEQQAIITALTARITALEAN